MQGAKIAEDNEAVSSSEDEDGDDSLGRPECMIAGEGPKALLESEQDDDDVTLTTIHNGTIIQCSSQVHDYRLRAPDLAHMSVWDFVSSVDKVVARASQQPIFDDEDPGNGDEDVHSVEYDSYDHPEVCTGPQTFQLDPGHMQSGKRVQQVRRNVSTHYTPVLIGPALPRRDSTLLYARYCCLMLILFKPWCVISDLQNPGEPWAEAFDRFVGTSSERIRHILNNMQVLHECKDAKDIEDRRRRNDRHNDSVSGWSDKYKVEEYAGNVDIDDLLEHLESVVNFAADRMSRTDADVIECLNEINQSGILCPPHQLEVTSADSQPDEIMLPDGLPLENMWRTMYDNWRNMWKKRLCTPPDPPSIVPLVPVSATISTFHEARGLPTVVHLDVSHQMQRQPVPIEAMIDKWTLNTEQAQVFSLMASHSQCPASTQWLHMFLGGPGGTGKS